MPKTVIIGCRLPHGLVLRHPLDRNSLVRLSGMNESRIIGATHVTTEVDAEFWADWKSENLEFTPFKSGAIFEAASLNDATAKAKELVNEKTGFEQISKDSPLMKNLGLTTRKE